MVNGTEIYAGVRVNGRWETTRLTDNGTPDLAPIVAARGGHALVAWRATAGSASTLEGGMPLVNYDDLYDAIRYRVYQNGAWGEIQTLYTGNLGNVQSLAVSMAEDGAAAVVYTVDTDLTGEKAEGEGLEVVFTPVNPDGEAGEMLRMTTNDTLDENPQVAAVRFSEQDEKFVVAWYAAEDAGSDIKFMALEKDGAYAPGFVDSITEAAATANFEVTEKFRFAKGQNLALEDLTLLWSEPVLAYSEESGTEAQADALRAVKFCRDEGRVYLTSALDVADMPASTTIDHFDASIDDSGTVRAVLLAGSYTGEPQHVAGEVYVLDSIASMETATATFENSVQADGVTVDYDSLRAGGKMAASFTVANTGISPITGLTIQIGESSETKTLRLLPNHKSTETIFYEVPAVVRDEDYRITAAFADGSSATFDGSLNLDVPDTGISTLEMKEWGDGLRTFTAALQNQSDVKFADHPERKVYLGVYSDANCEAESLVPITVNGETVEGGLYQLKNSGETSELTMLDHSNLVLKLSYDITPNLQDGLFPDDGIQLYVRVWAEEEDESGEPYVIAEYNQSNNLRSIRFTDPVAANSGVQHDVEVEYATENGKTTADVTVKNLSMAQSQEGNLVATLKDERGETLETKLYATDSTGLIALQGEQSLTYPVAFSQAGGKVEAAYFPVDTDQWNNQLALLSATGVTLEAFQASRLDYEGLAYNLPYTTVTAAAQNPGARVEIFGANAQQPLAGGTGAASLKLRLEYTPEGETPVPNALTVVVTPVEPQAEKRTYSLNITDEHTEKGVVTLEQDAALHQGWTNAAAVTVRSRLNDVEDFNPVASAYRINGANWTETQNAQLEVRLDEEGQYTIEGRLTGDDGYSRSAGSLELFIDRTKPVLHSDKLTFTETSRPLLKETGGGLLAGLFAFFQNLFSDGNTQYQLQVEVPAEDDASGLDALWLEAGEHTYSMELAQNAAGEDVWRGTVQHEYRGGVTVHAKDIAGNEETYTTQDIVISDSITTKLELACTEEPERFAVAGGFHLQQTESDMAEYGMQYRAAGSEAWQEMTAQAGNTPNRFTFSAEGLARGTHYEYRTYSRLVTENEISYGETIRCRTLTVVDAPAKAEGSCGKCGVTASAATACPGDVITYTLTACEDHTPRALTMNGAQLNLSGEGLVRTALYTVKDADATLTAEAAFGAKQPQSPATLAEIHLQTTDVRAVSDETLADYLNSLSYEVEYDNGTRETVNTTWSRTGAALFATDFMGMTVERRVEVSGETPVKPQATAEETDTTLKLTGGFTLEEGAKLAVYRFEYRKEGEEAWQTMKKSFGSNSGSFTFTAKNLEPGSYYEWRAVTRLDTEDAEQLGSVSTIRTQTTVNPGAVENCTRCKIEADRPYAKVGGTVVYTITNCNDHTPDTLTVNGRALPLAGEGGGRSGSYQVLEEEKELNAAATVRDKLCTGLEQPLEGMFLLDTDGRNDTAAALKAYVDSQKVKVLYDNGTKATLRLDWNTGDAYNNAGGFYTYTARHAGYTAQRWVHVQRDEEYYYWHSVLHAIEKAAPGSEIRSNILDYLNVPGYVLTELAKHPDVTLTLQRGEDILRLAGSQTAALMPNTNYLYAGLLALAKETAPAGPESTGSGAAPQDKPTDGQSGASSASASSEASQPQASSSSQSATMGGQESSSGSGGESDVTVVPSPGDTPQGGFAWQWLLLPLALLAAAGGIVILVLRRRKKEQEPQEAPQPVK